MDAVGVQRTADDLLVLTGCTQAPISSTLSARLHRGLGLFLVTQGEQEAAAAAFMSARRASPTLALTDALAPPGSIVDQLHDRPIVDMPHVKLDPPSTGSLLTDGVLSDKVTPGRPVLLQHLGPRGQILGTWWLSDPTELPPDPWAAGTSGRRARVRVGGGVSLALGVAALGLAGMSASAHRNPDAPRTEGQLRTYRDASRIGTIMGSGLLLGGSAAVVVSYSWAPR